MDKSLEKIHTALRDKYCDMLAISCIGDGTIHMESVVELVTELAASGYVIAKWADGTVIVRLTVVKINRANGGVCWECGDQYPVAILANDSPIVEKEFGRFRIRTEDFVEQRLRSYLALHHAGRFHDGLLSSMVSELMEVNDFDEESIVRAIENRI